MWGSYIAFLKWLDCFWMNDLGTIIGHLYYLVITQFRYWLCIGKKLKKLALEASSLLDVEVMKGLSVLTIRHYNEETIEKLTAGKTIILKQQTPETIQFLIG